MQLSFGLPRVEPINVVLVIGPDLFQVSDEEPYERRIYWITEAPDCVDIVVLCECLPSVGPRTILTTPPGQIAGIEDLIEITDDGRLLLGGNRDNRIPSGNCRQNKRDRKPSKDFRWGR